MALLIRAATEADIPDILELINDAILHSTAIYQDALQTVEMRTEWYHHRLQAGYPVIVAEVDGQFAGFASYGEFRHGYGYRFTVEHSVYISAGRQGKGIGKSLVKELITIARDKGLHSIIAGIDADTTASINMHLSLGFKEIAHLTQVGYKFGRWLDVKLLQLIL